MDCVIVIVPVVVTPERLTVRPQPIGTVPVHASDGCGRAVSVVVTFIVSCRVTAARRGRAAAVRRLIL